MDSGNATTVDEYVSMLPADRREAIVTLRNTINANLPEGYVEGMQWGMPMWFIPLERYPDTYNKQPLGLVALCSQKNHMALYMMSVYGDPELEAWFRKEFADRGKKLDMGKSCVRFKKLDAIPIDLIAETIKRVSVEDFLARYEAVKGKAAVAVAATTKEAPNKKVLKIKAVMAAKGATAKPKVVAAKPTKKAAPAKVAAKAPARKK